MKVAIVSPSVSWHGGGERYPLELCRALQKMGVDSEILTFNFDKADTGFAYEGLVIRGLSSKGKEFNPFPNIREFYRTLRDYDIVHVHQIRSWPTQLSLLMRRLNLIKSVVVTDHAGGGRSLERLLHTSKYADAGAAVSFASNAISFRSVAKTHLVYGGYNSDIFFAAQKDTSSKPVICYIGRILPYKGLDVLARAIPTDASLLIAGNIVDESYYNLCTSILRERNIDYRYLGQVNDKEIREIFWAADLHVLPSRRFDLEGNFLSSGELFPLSLIEGLACGTPFLSTTSGGPPELAAITRGGYICEDGNVEALASSLESLLREPDELRRSGGVGAKVVRQKFSWKSVAERTIAVYEEVLRERSNA